MLKSGSDGRSGFCILSETFTETLVRAAQYRFSSSVALFYRFSLAQSTSGELGPIVLSREHAGNT
jgi:hypothetical protein